MISAIIENVNTDDAKTLSSRNNLEFDYDNKKPKNFKKGNKRWFKAKKDLMKFSPQKGIELGKKIARNASIGVIWIYEPGLLLAEELVSPCFGLICYYPNVQVTVMKGERFLGIICDARDHKPINTDRFKWYVAVGDNLTFTARYYVKEGAYIKEGQELGHLSKPARSVGRVAIKSRARCSGIIVLCKTGLVNTGEEFLRISCDAAPGTADIKNSLVDESHTSLLDQSDMGKSIPKLRGLAQISPEEADYDGEKFKLPQIMNSVEEDSENKKDDNDDEESDVNSEIDEAPITTKKDQATQTEEEDRVKLPVDNSNTLDNTISLSESNIKANTGPQNSSSDPKKTKNFFDFALDEDDDEPESNQFAEKDESKEEQEFQESGNKQEILSETNAESNKKGHVDAGTSTAETKCYNTIIQTHNSKPGLKPKKEEKQVKNYNRIDPLKHGEAPELDGLSSSIVSEVDISSIG
ncbi:signal peptide-containing protein [Cryptosporidium canis]|uniref:Signal peptide-containing protein n=1 Tax=Cryptosporidium canis TaxID=195482 RepID=A0A9D5HXU9_9CRYT|nr:signal peptide-containing protein [Cryptosporidium canis]